MMMSLCLAESRYICKCIFHLAKVIVDLAAQGGGNCELTKLNEIVTTPNGVTIIGYADMPARSAVIWGDRSKVGCCE